MHRYSSCQVTSDFVSRFETYRSILFEIEIPCILLFLNWNKNSQNSPKRMHPTCRVNHVKVYHVTIPTTVMNISLGGGSIYIANQDKLMQPITSLHCFQICLLICLLGLQQYLRFGCKSGSFEVVSI